MKMGSKVPQKPPREFRIPSYPPPPPYPRETSEQYYARTGAMPEDKRTRKAVPMASEQARAAAVEIVGETLAFYGEPTEQELRVRRQQQDRDISRATTIIDSAITAALADQRAELTTLRTQCQVAEAERDYARRLLSADAQEVMRLRQQWIDDERDLTTLAEENEQLQSLLYRATEDAGRQRD